jgi:hypothetical protein
VRVEVELTREIGHVKHADVVAHERQWHDERYETAAIVGERPRARALTLHPIGQVDPVLTVMSRTFFPTRTSFMDSRGVPSDCDAFTPK